MRSSAEQHDEDCPVVSCPSAEQASSSHAPEHVESHGAPEWNKVTVQIPRTNGMEIQHLQTHRGNGPLHFMHAKVRSSAFITRHKRHLEIDNVFASPP